MKKINFYLASLSAYCIVFAIILYIKEDRHYAHILILASITALFSLRELMPKKTFAILSIIFSILIVIYMIFELFYS